jgi:hypothetical protein
MPEAPKSVLVFGAVGTEVYVDNLRYELVVLNETGSAMWRGKCESCWSTIFVETSGGKLPAIRRCNAHRRKNDHPPLAEFPAEPRTLRPPDTMPAADFLPVPGADFEIDVDKLRQALDARAVAMSRGIWGNPLPAAAAAMEILQNVAGSIQTGPQPTLGKLFGKITVGMGDADATTVSVDIPSHHPELTNAGRRDTNALPGGGFVSSDGTSNGVGEPTGDEPSAAEIDPYGHAALLADLADLAPEGGEDADIPPPPSEDQVWGPRLELFVQNKMWLDEWGGKPNEASCAAPPHMLRAYGIRAR